MIDSRETENGNAIRRRRRCEKCDYRFTTYERVDAANFVVVKKDAMRQPFSREKLEKSLWVACQKRPVRKDQIDIVLNAIEDELRGEKEVASRKIGNLVMKALKQLDDVAYIRYAIVYLGLDDLQAVRDEIDFLLEM